MVGPSARGMVCRFRYGIGVEMPHLHHCDIVYVKTYACCLELFHRAVLDCFWHDKYINRCAIDMHHSIFPYWTELSESHDGISDADDGSV